MTENVYVIGDIAGNFVSLMNLIAQFKPPFKIVALGDVIDRGPRSKEVIEFLRSADSGDIITLMGNHEWIACNDTQCWLDNGGWETIESFGSTKESDPAGPQLRGDRFPWKGSIPNEVFQWFNSLPWSHDIEIDGYTYKITHAPIPDPNARKWREHPVELWNRYDPVRIEGCKLQVFGHNAHIEEFKDDRGRFAMCIDGSHDGVLAAIELPSQEIIMTDLVG